jgi:two-component system response regulator AtoC
MVERALILSGGHSLDLVHFPIDAEPSQASAPAAPSPLSDLRLEPAVGELESRMIAEALKRAGGSKTRAAQLLDISERSVWYKVKKYGLSE